ncbi:C45 family autoproteolytic acyltransferase/hydolase [Winogradskyella luteola]|uniref:Linear amide C-N hydrolase n=1 Tax=Winogradskyella luteola TaxID=2828330 RepID=A0A9X1FA75_9FLAO|nr:C45 family peptidase [Winogradskyella luteola]MBV7270319.1 linear amide C-N hydrolase [Winogradskyella luteola]
MYHPRLYGSFYDMGYKYGNLLHKKAGFKLPHIETRQKDFGEESMVELQRFYPEIMDEIYGFADGIKDHPYNVASFLLSLVAFDYNGRCSVFAFKNRDSMVIGRNYDMLFQFKKFTESSLIAPTNKLAYISQSDVFIGRSDGINEKGVFIAMSFVNGTTIQPGVSFHFIVRKVLENAYNIEEAITIIKKAKAASSNNFLIADANGDMAIVESAPEKTHVIKPTEGKAYLHITNQFASKEMQPYDKGKVGWSKSIERYQGIYQSLKELSKLDLQKAKEILSDPCVCLNLRQEKFGTIWSVVAELNSLTIERAETKPRITNYKTETRLDWWLKKQSKKLDK